MDKVSNDLPGENIPLLGRFEIREREDEISILIGSNSTSDKAVWENLTSVRLFKRNKGEFYEEHNVCSSTDDPQTAVAQEMLKTMNDMWPSTPLGQFSAFPCFCEMVPISSVATSTKDQYIG